MATRIPASPRTREGLTALIEGRFHSIGKGRAGEAGNAADREHGAQPGQGYRNGYRTGRLKTAEGVMEYSAPQIAGRDEPFRINKAVPVRPQKMEPQWDGPHIRKQVARV